MGRFEVHSHTHYSNIRLLDCINFPEKLIDKAIELGLKGICITDHESLGGHVVIDKYEKEIQKEHPDFKVGKGNEIYLVDTRDIKQKYWHFILVAKNQIGHKMLRELSSIAWQNSYFDRGLERVPTLKSELEDIINKYGKGNLIASTACLGSELDGLILKMDEAEQNNDIQSKTEAYFKIIDFVNWCKKLFEDDFYFEVQPAQSKEQMIVNRRMGTLSKYFNVKIIVTTDAHYLIKEDRSVHKAYLNSKNGEREVDSFYQYAYLQSTEEVIENLKDTGLDYYELEKNTWEIYDKIETYSLFHSQQVPQVEVKNYPKINSSLGYPTIDYLFQSDNIQERYWVNYCVNKLKELDLYNTTYLSRLEEEADIQKTIGDKLNTCMFAYPVFLQHYINLFWKCGSTVGAGRGSACAGLNHFLLGVTQLDPIVENLPYWRYSNKDRIELGDIDIDICPSKREKIFEEIRKERGQLGCVQVCTYGTESTRSAIQTACRGYRSEEYPDGIDVDIAQYMTSLAPQERGFVWPIHDLIYGNEEKDRKPIKRFIEEVKKYPGLINIIENIEGLINHRGIHASGVNMYGDDPFETACFMKATNGAIVTQYSLHDAEYCGDVKYDFLVTEVQDVIVQCLQMLQEHGEIESNYSLRQIYNKYLHPTVLPINDEKIWNALAEGNILKLFQFDSQVGGQTVKMLRPQTPKEMANANSAMRLVAIEKGGETPSERIKRMKNDISQWYKELNEWNLSEEEIEVLKPYYLPNYAMPAQQEDMMLILMDENICNFSLKEANDARKICAKKQMNRIEELHEKVLSKAKSRNLGAYVWETAIRPQMGYSFSKIHSLAYSYIGLQTAYLATYFNPIYWNTACLRVDAGLEEDSSTNYSKVAKAIGNVINKGIKVSLIDINKSQYMFEPDPKKGQIIFGMKGLSGINGDIIEEIIANRPYESLEDFLNKVKVNKTQAIALIKAGAFDEFEDREQVMRDYIWMVCEPKKRITMQNFNGLNQRDLLPSELNFQKRTFIYNKALKEVQKGETFIIEDNYYRFYEKFFDIDLLQVDDDGKLVISKNVWKKQYDKAMEPAKLYLKEHSEELLKKLNNSLFDEMWEKYAAGSLAKWEMDSLSFYASPHELINVNQSMYNIIPFNSLSEEPEVDYMFKRGAANIPIYKTHRIMGTIIAKDDMKSCVSLLTVDSGVVTIKMSKDFYASRKKKISQIGEDGEKHYIEDSFFKKGTLCVCNGYRRGDMFFLKSYKKSNSHQFYKINKINKNGTVEMEYARADELEEI